eukprot:CAMPEP_0117422210 /NCGR_PEP_ID=MMETSP0758-20121206/3093_1 /TAXON_ID=63605 /ORGANISM="Percolomonas cosmopolitus, Strain AE-1 (ATCC 50343)" /LENGTH=332 /DNA_ID=CAMNT_0005204689 /DNA_START=252 /DNA_END=1250 /DNA_ORIENTATION=+
MKILKEKQRHLLKSSIPLSDDETEERTEEQVISQVELNGSSESEEEVTINVDENTSSDDERHFLDEIGAPSTSLIVPKAFLTVCGIPLNSKYVGLWCPVITEVLFWVLFTLSMFIRLFHRLKVVERYLYAEILLSVAPMLMGIGFALISTLPPFDILSALDLNDRMIIYNSDGIVFNNTALEQYEREVHYGGGFAEDWEAINSQNRSILLIDQIIEISIAVSLEIHDKLAVHQPWLYFRSVTTIGKEYRVTIPIRLPRRMAINRLTRLMNWIFGSCNHVSEAPIYDGLHLEEINELLSVLNERKPVLSTNIHRVIKALTSNVSDLGYEMNLR